MTRSVAALRLQTAAEALVEAAQTGQETEVAISYGTFLYEVRCLKTNICKYTDSKPSLEAIDLFSNVL